MDLQRHTCFLTNMFWLTRHTYLFKTLHTYSWSTWAGEHYVEVARVVQSALSLTQTYLQLCLRHFCLCPLKVSHWRLCSREVQVPPPPSCNMLNDRHRLSHIAFPFTLLCATTLFWIVLSCVCTQAAVVAATGAPYAQIYLFMYTRCSGSPDLL